MIRINQNNHLLCTFVRYKIFNPITTNIIPNIVKTKDSTIEVTDISVIEDPWRNSNMIYDKNNKNIPDPNLKRKDLFSIPLKFKLKT